ncbi:MAG: PilZ domain-containing protein [Salinibacterium sp.]|nr:PilZ domain-containing protein [Salinibacterium sp.]
MATPDRAETTTDTSIAAPTGPALRLAGQRTESDPIPFERRHTPRMTDGRCGLAVLANEDDGSVAIAPVTLCDTSEEGIGLISRIQPRLGQTARLMIPGAPYDGADARIVRVTPEGDAWRVGMRIRRRLAA